jgi:EAL domain-containing protein (putative c-di-GMP-specific phosphodiesterase class I)
MAAFDGGDRNVGHVIGTIAALGRSLDLRITVEGVENERQLRFIEELHCDQAQGFYLARPMAHADVAPFILGEFQKALPAPKSEDAPRLVQKR